MKKKLVLLMAVVMILGSMSVAFADSSFNPASIFAKFKGIDEEEAFQMRRDAGMSFGELAQDEEFYGEFRQELQESKKSRLNELVKDGVITQERADEILASFENCDGTREFMHENRGMFRNKDNRENNKGFGNGNGFGRGQQRGCAY